MNQEAEDEEDLAQKQMQGLILKIHTYVTINLLRHRERNRDEYKDSVVYQARKEVIADFFLSMTLKKCQNERCRACVCIPNRVSTGLTLFSPVIAIHYARKGTPRSSSWTCLRSRRSFTKQWVSDETTSFSRTRRTSAN